MRKEKIDDGERIGLLRDVGAVENGFGGLEVPIAKLAPEKAIQCLGRLVEAVAGQRVGDLRDGRVEPGENPLVIARQARRLDFGLDTAGLQLAEPAGVPEFIAEVTAELDLLFVKENILPEG